MSWKSKMLNEVKLMEGESPFYTDFLYRVQEDYPGAGLGNCDWDISTTEPKLFALKDVLVEHFNLVYKYREIASETEERWQWTIDKVFDNIKRKYEYALGLYEDNDIAKLGRFYHEEITRDASMSSYGSSSSDSSSTSKNTFNDTPIEELMATGNYASAITDVTNDSDSTANSTRDSDVDETITRDRHDSDKSLLESANININKFIDIVDSFIDEFKQCFMTTLGRI